MRFVHRVLVGGLMLSLSAPVFAARPAPALRGKAVKVGASTARIGKAVRSPFRYMTAMKNFEDGEFATVRNLLGKLKTGALATSFVDKEHTDRIDHVDLNALDRRFVNSPEYQAYESSSLAQAVWQKQNPGNAHRVAGIPSDIIRARDEAFRRIFNEFPDLRDNMYSVVEMNPSERAAYPIRREVPTQEAASPVHAAVASMKDRTDASPATKRMLAKALDNPLTLALVMQVGARAETQANIGKGTNETQRAAARIYDGIATILQAQDREWHGPGLAHHFRNEDPLFKFKVSRMWSNTTARADQIKSLPREQIMEAAKGVLTKAELNEAIIGLDL